MPAAKKPYILTGFVILFWSTIPSAFKISLKFFSVPQLLLFSTLVSTISLFIILVMQGKLGQLKELLPSDYFRSLLLGFLNPFLYYLAVLKAYTLLPAQQAQPLNMTWGIVLVLISIPILKQKIRVIDILAVFISFCGVVIISTEGNFSSLQVKNPLGVLLAVGSSFIWAFYWILNLKDTREPLVRLFLNFIFASIFILAACLLFFPFGSVSWAGVGGAVYIGFFEMGITYALWLQALRLAPTTASVAILIYIVPFISFIFVHIFVRERILPSSVIGAAFVVTGIVLNKYREVRKKVAR